MLWGGLLFSHFSTIQLSVFDRVFSCHMKNVVVLSSHLKRLFTCDFFRKVTGV